MGLVSRVKARGSPCAREVGWWRVHLGEGCLHNWTTCGVRYGERGPAESHRELGAVVQRAAPGCSGLPAGGALSSRLLLPCRAP